jgi:hypothetical protein
MTVSLTFLAIFEEFNLTLKNWKFLEGADEEV